LSAGKTPIFISGRLLHFKQPKTIKIYSISFEFLTKNRSDIKEKIKKWVSEHHEGKWSIKVLEHFGKDVTEDFSIQPFYSINSIINQPNINTDMEATLKTKIFISHSSKNEKLVKSFVDIILDNALNFNTSLIFCTSIEGLGIKSGEDFRQRIKSELLNAKVVIQIISDDYKKSEVCLNEMGAAWVLADEVIPFVVDNNYDIGFINSNTQQLKLKSKKDILKFIDDYSILFPQKSPYAKIDRHIDQFIEAIKTNSIEVSPIDLPVKTNLQQQIEIIYYDCINPTQFDFEINKQKNWDAKQRKEVGEKAGGEFNIINNVLNIDRTDNHGRLGITLRKYTKGNETYDCIRMDPTVGHKRKIYVTFEIKSIKNKKHLLDVVLRDTDSYDWIDNKEISVQSYEWKKIEVFLLASPDKSFRVKLYDKYVESPPNSFQLRNLKVIEKY